MKYWPGEVGEASLFGSFQLELSEDEKDKGDYVTRKFKLSHVDAVSTCVRKVACIAIEAVWYRVVSIKSRYLNVTCMSSIFILWSVVGFAISEMYMLLIFVAEQCR